MYECQLCQQKMCTFLVIEIRLDFIFFKVSKKTNFCLKSFLQSNIHMHLVLKDRNNKS